MPRELTKLTRDAVARLQGETGHALCLDDYDDIAALDSVAQKIVDPDDSDELALLGFPVRVGPAWLYPMTLGNSLWLEQRAEAWFRGLPLYDDLALAFALAHGRTPFALWQLTDRRSAMRAIKRWRRGLGCTYQELIRAVKRVLPPSDDEAVGPDDKANRTQYGPILALVCREYGNTPEHWMWDEPVTRVQALVEQYRARMDAEAEGEYRAAQRAGVKGLRVPKTLKLRRNVKFDKMVKLLREKWLAT